MKHTLHVSESGLTQCPGCHAHIRVEGQVQNLVCPFCDWSAAGVAAPRTSLGKTRGSLLAAGLLGISLTVACSPKPTPAPAYGVPPTENVQEQTPDGGSPDKPLPQPAYGIPPVENVVEQDAGPDTPPPAPAYGVPPSP